MRNVLGHKTLAACSFLVALSCLQGPQAQSIVKSNDKLIGMTVVVKTAAGESATALTREMFRVSDEKELRPVEFFEDETTPASVGVLIDTSGSMQNLKRFATPQAIGRAISKIFQGGERNEYFIATFARKLNLITDWEPGSSLINGKTSITIGDSYTAFYDSCFAAVEKLQTGHYSKKTLVLLSDGDDNVSQHTVDQLRKLIKSSDISLYGIALRIKSDVPPLKEEGYSVLAGLTEMGGGAVFFPENEKQFDDAADRIADDLRHQYRIGIRSNDSSTPNKWRRLNVSLVNASAQPATTFVIRSRKGYYTK